MRRLLCWIGLHPPRPRLHFVESGRLVDVVMDCRACGRVLAAGQYEMIGTDHEVWKRN